MFDETKVKICFYLCNNSVRGTKGKHQKGVFFIFYVEMLLLFKGFDNRNEYQCVRNEDGDDRHAVDVGGRGEDDEAKRRPEQGKHDTLRMGEGFAHRGNEM